MGVIEELKRRNVFRVAAAYIVASWIVLQVLDVLGPILDIPDWVPRTVLYLLVLGFFAAVVLSWIYELTEKGIQRDEDTDGTRIAQQFGGRKLDFVIIALLSVAVAFMVLDNYIDWEPDRSVAVLPFRDLSPESEYTGFVNGMHSDILTRLSKLRVLDKVIGRGTAGRYRDSDVPLPEIARELDVAAVLTGDVQRFGDRIRVNVHLVDAESGAEIWAERFERTLTARNLFTAQADIARGLASRLHGELSDEEDGRLAGVPTENIEALNEFNRGRQEMWILTPERIGRAIAFYERAIELDPDYAEAWAALADALGLLYAYDAGISVPDVRDRWLASAEKALEIDPASAEAYTAIARLKLETGEPELAAENLREAIEFSPNNAAAHALLGATLRYLGQREEALEYSRKAIELDPRPPPDHTAGLAWALIALGQVDEAESIVTRGLRDDPEFHAYYLSMWFANWRSSNYGRALRWAEAGIPYLPRHPQLQQGRCRTMIDLDMQDSAEQCIVDYEQRFGPAPKMRNDLDTLRGAHQDVVARVQPLLDSEEIPRNLRMRVGADLVAAGHSDLAWQFVQADPPAWFGDGPVEFDEEDQFLMFPMACLLYANGDKDRANYLFDGILEEVSGKPRWQFTGTLDVAIHAIRGDVEEAAAALRSSIDEGMLAGWWYYQRSPMYGEMRADPRLAPLLAEMEAGIARQREWYQAHRDEPLY